MYRPTPDKYTPSQEEFVRRLAGMPHTRDEGPATKAELGLALKFLNDIIECAREIAARDKLEPVQPPWGVCAEKTP